MYYVYILCFLEKKLISNFNFFQKTSFFEGCKFNKIEVEMKSLFLFSFFLS